MSSRKSTSSRRSGSTTAPSAETTDRSSSTTNRSSSTANRSSSTHAHRTPEEKLASAVRSVVRHNGPEAAENIFNQALDQSGHSRSGRFGTSHSESDGRCGGHRSSSSAHPSTASSRSSARSGSEYTRSSRDSATSSHITRSSSSSHRSGSSARSISTADSRSTYTPSNYRDGRSSTSSRYPAGQRDSAGSESYVESIPEDDESQSSAQPEEGYDELVPAPTPYGASLADLAGIRAGHNPRPGAHTIASFEGGTDARGNTYNILNVVNIYDHRPPPPAFGLWIAPPLPGWRCSCCPAGPDGVYRGCRRHGSG